MKRTHFPSLKIILVPANNSGRILVQSEMEAMSLKIVREREREDNTSVSVPRQNWLNTEETVLEKHAKSVGTVARERERERLYFLLFLFFFFSLSF